MQPETPEDLTNVLWVYKVEARNWEMGAYRVLYVHASEEAPRALNTYDCIAKDELDAWQTFKRVAAKTKYTVEFRSLSNG